MWYDAFVFSFYAIMHFTAYVLMTRKVPADKQQSASEALGEVVLLFLVIAACYEGWQWMGWVQ